MSISGLVPPGPSRRRAGTGLLVYGLVGVVLLGSLALAVIAAGIMGRDGFTRVDDSLDEVVAILDSTAAALAQADVTLAGVGTSLTETAGAVEEAAVLAGIVSDGAATLAQTATDFGVLGQRPFEAMVVPLQETSESLARLAERLDATAASLAVNATDVTLLAEKLGAVATSLEAGRDRLASVDTQLGSVAVLGSAVVLVMLGWLAVPAVAAIWVGRRWRAENLPGA